MEIIKKNIMLSLVLGIVCLQIQAAGPTAMSLEQMAFTAVFNTVCDQSGGQTKVTNKAALEELFKVDGDLEPARHVYAMYRELFTRSAAEDLFAYWSQDSKQKAIFLGFLKAFDFFVQWAKASIVDAEFYGPDFKLSVSNTSVFDIFFQALMRLDPRMAMVKPGADSGQAVLIEQLEKINKNVFDRVEMPNMPQFRSRRAGGDPTGSTHGESDGTYGMGGPTIFDIHGGQTAFVLRDGSQSVVRIEPGASVTVLGLDDKSPTRPVGAITSGFVSREDLVQLRAEIEGLRQARELRDGEVNISAAATTAVGGTRTNYWSLPSIALVSGCVVPVLDAASRLSLEGVTDPRMAALAGCIMIVTPVGVWLKRKIFG